MNSARSLAFLALNRWRQGREYADRIVGELLAQSSLGEADRAFALELFYGALRNLSLLDFWIAQLRSQPLDAGSRDILRLGFYQIFLLQTAPHAAVFETVALAPARARKLINAILRRALREKDNLINLSEAQPAAIRFSQPDFLIEKWTRQFSRDAALEICRWNNLPAPIYARVNRLQLRVEDFLARYPGSSVLESHENFVRLPNPIAAARAGDCYLQDPSTALACELLAPAPGEIVLDACAAPGGKTAYLAELMSGSDRLIAADYDAKRLPRLRENLVRLKANSTRVMRCDWTDPASIRAAGLTENSFDKILLDAPCTNTGVMRRRVDVRWRVRPNEYVRMAQTQLRILQALAPLLKSGGALVYSTCSLETEENEQVMDAFLQSAPAFRLTNSKTSLPFRDHFDGAFAARLQKAIPFA